MKVEADEFEVSLARLVLDLPLTVRPTDAGRFVRTSTRGYGAAADTVWQLALRREDGRWCRAYEAPGDCLSLLEDGLGFGPKEKLAVALGLSLDPLHESMADALEGTFSPAFFKAVVVSAMVSRVMLAADPGPVFTKAAAVLAAVLVAYLGVDAFLEMVTSCQELMRATDAATTFRELEAAGERFGKVMGEEGARLFVLATTVLLSRGVTGSAAWLARLPQLPRFAEAAALGARQAGFRLEAVESVTAVAVVEGRLVISLAPNAVAMAAAGTADSAGSRSWGSYSGFRKASGPAGPGKEWHHIVEQTPGNVQRFGAHALHNTENVIPLDKGLHERVSAFFSSKRFFITNSESLTVREWLRTQSFQAQRHFGLTAIENIRDGVWR